MWLEIKLAPHAANGAAMQLMQGESIEMPANSWRAQLEREPELRKRMADGTLITRDLGQDESARLDRRFGERGASDQ